MIFIDMEALDNGMEALDNGAHSLISSSASAAGKERLAVIYLYVCAFLVFLVPTDWLCPEDCLFCKPLTIASLE